jgi:hypothetical protein
VRRDPEEPTVATVVDVPEILQGLPPASPAIQEMAQSGLADHEQATAALKSAMKPELVKGAGFRGPGGNKPLEDPMEITSRMARATLDIRTASAAGHHNRGAVIKSMNPMFLHKYGALKAALERPNVGDQLQSFMSAVASPDVVRSFTAGNLAINSVH